MPPILDGRVVHYGLAFALTYVAELLGTVAGPLTWAARKWQPLRPPPR
jgi:hypothetical protein